MSSHILTDIEIEAAIASQPLIMAPSVSMVEMLSALLSPSSVSSCVLVLENQRLVGIVTERDAVGLIVTGQNLTDLVVADVMTSPVITLRRSDCESLTAPLRLLQQHRIRHLPIVDDQEQILGVLTYDSLVTVLNPLETWRRVESLEQKVSCLQAECLLTEADLHSSQKHYQALLDGATNTVVNLTDRLELVLKSAQIGIWEWDVASDRLIWDERMYEIYGIPAADFGGNHQAWMQLVHPEDRNQFQPNQHQPKQGERISHTEFRILWPAGGVRAISSSALVQYDCQGKPQRVVGLNIDITDRKRAEIGLNKSQRFIQQIADASPNILYLYDLQEQRNIYANREIAEILGYTPHEIQAMGKNFFGQVMHPEDLQHMPARMAQLQGSQDGEIFEYVYRMKHADGNWRWLKSRDAVFSRDASGTITQTIGTAEDITDRQEYEQNLERSNTELLRATRLKDEFLANMSHELRTPLNAILGISEGLQEEVYGAINERQRRSLATIERSGKHLLALINDILEVSKIAAGKLELDCAPVDVAQLCKSSLPFIKEQAAQKNIQLTAQIPTDGGNVIVDERRVCQVLINLLSNAVKFTPAGGRVTLAVWMEEAEKRLDAKPALCFQVSDTGIGIAVDDLDKLFQPFMQIDSRLNRQHEGTGLGLTLVKQIVELHGGIVRVQSELGQGSCFTVTLPVGEPSATVAGIPPASLQNTPKVMKIDSAQPPLILLVEDNPANIETLMDYLGGHGYRLILAQNGQEAIDLATAQPPDLIVMDIQMPEMDGLEAMRQIRANPAFVSLPIIALTALVMPADFPEGNLSDRERCLAAGANEYLSKPVKSKQLVQTIHDLLITMNS